MMAKAIKATKKPQHHCARCGYDWEPKLKHEPAGGWPVPKSCPACKRYDWKE